MTTELDKVKSKIRALTMKTIANGCTEEEALAAMEKVGELLEIYNLELSEVHLSAEPCIKASINLCRRTNPYWAYIFNTIGVFTQTKAWMSKPNVCFYGLEPDVQLAVYLSKLILTAMEAESRRFKQTHTYRRSLRRRHLTRSFQVGLVRRLNDRLEALRPRGKGLVLVKTHHIEKEFAKAHPNTRFRPLRRQAARVNTDAYEAGKAAGDNINLNRPLSGPSTTTTITGYLQ
ncbi:DUF2786 domain-containing protein [Mesorhizobium sp.]|uniref:DUF2786 domain-containing protein n=1 Tax=Mesorhizobium sp. TaxID=1871066 RepID=UPI0025DB1680|nr:DUF2786 domain-containing protein [Mesorhizobium sp.]